MTAAGTPTPRPIGLAKAALAALSIQWRAAPVTSAVLTCTTLAMGAAPAAGAWLTKLLLDELGAGRLGSARLTGLALGIAGAGAASVVLYHAARYLGERVRYAVAFAVEDRLFGRVCQLRGLGQLENPELHNRLMLAEKAAQDAPDAVTGFAQEALRSSITIAGFAGTLLMTWPPMALVLLACAAPTLAARVIQARRESDATTVMAGTVRRRAFYRSLLTDIRAAKEIRVFGLGAFLRHRMMLALTESSNARLAIMRQGAVTQSLLALGSAAAIGFGVLGLMDRAADGRYSVGDVALFLTAVAGTQAATIGLVLYAGEALHALHLFRYYLEVTDLPDTLGNGTRAVCPLRRGIEFRDVWFRYTMDGPWVLRGLNLWLAAGRTTGVVGLNGAGKSTVVKLLCRFYDPNRGQILWDGVDLRQLEVGQLRERIGALFQDFMTYDLTFAENIGLGDARRIGDRVHIKRAASLVDLDAVVERLPRGYDTMLSRAFRDTPEQTDALSLSGGQWQRIALARTLIRTSVDLVILDEPSASLDAAAERHLAEMLRTATAGFTRVLISHRLGSLREADTIVVLAGERVAEQGNHAELMALDGHYARLFRLQAQAFRHSAVPVPEPR